MSVKDDKAEAREQAKRARQFIFDNFDPAGYERLSKNIQSIIRGFDGSPTVSAYYPIGSEIDCRPALMDLVKMGCRLCLPAIASGEGVLRFREYLPGDDLVVGKMDTREPHPSAPQINPNVLLVPLLAFDAAGARLGYGGGYYDKTISNLRSQSDIVCIGVGYEKQIVNRVPSEAHDQIMDFIATEAGIIQVCKTN